MHWVYILQNPPGKFHVGQTDNLPVLALRIRATCSMVDS